MSVGVEDVEGEVRPGYLLPFVSLGCFLFFFSFVLCAWVCGLVLPLMPVWDIPSAVPPLAGHG